MGELILNYVDQLNNLPIMPDTASKILQMADSGMDFSFKELENIIKLDPGLSSKILKIANSALYSRPKEITSLQMAISLIGFKNISSIVVLATATALKKNESYSFYKDFWADSVISAFIAKDLAMKTSYEALQEEAFLAALLHNIGQIAFFNADPAKYNRLYKLAGREQVKLSLLEKRAFHTDHREVGAQVLASWNFPEIFIDTAKEHSLDNITSPHKKMILIVSVSEFLTGNIRVHKDKPRPLEEIKKYLPFLNMHIEQLNDYTENFIQSLEDDPLFKECSALFNFTL